MGWWKKLKGWQKAGVIVGSTHFILNMVMLLLDPTVAVYLLSYMELPWVSLLMTLGLTKGLGVSKYVDLIVINIIGTFVYALFGMAIGLLLSVIVRKINRKR